MFMFLFASELKIAFCVFYSIIMWIKIVKITLYIVSQYMTNIFVYVIVFFSEVLDIDFENLIFINKFVCQKTENQKLLSL